MAIATDVYQEVLFSDGEGVDPDDLNELQRRMRGIITDALLMPRMPNVQDDGLADVLDPELGDWAFSSNLDDACNSLAWAPYPHIGFASPGVGARQLVVRPGTFVQRFNPPDGATADAPCVIAFLLAAELTLTTAVGDAANPRVDLVEMKLEYVEDSPDARDFEDAVTRAKSTTNPDKARRVQATFQIKAGTPGAIPAYPAPTAGFVPVAAVWVPALHNAVHTLAHLRDLRMPLGGVRVYDVSVEGFNLVGSGANPWTSVPGEYRALADPTAAGFMYAACPIGGHASRLLAVGVMGEFPSDGDVKLYDLAMGVTTPVHTLLADLEVEIHDELAAGPRFAWAHMRHFMEHGAVDIVDEGTPIGLIGTPMWTNGQLCGPAFEAGVMNPAHTTIHRLAMQFTGDTPDTGTTISLVRFVVAHGM